MICLILVVQVSVQPPGSCSGTVSCCTGTKAECKCKVLNNDSDRRADRQQDTVMKNHDRNQQNMMNNNWKLEAIAWLDILLLHRATWLRRKRFKLKIRFAERSNGTLMSWDTITWTKRSPTLALGKWHSSIVEVGERILLDQTCKIH